MDGRRSGRADAARGEGLSVGQTLIESSFCRATSTSQAINLSISITY
jgi:hypothetical protein